MAACLRLADAQSTICSCYAYCTYMRLSRLLTSVLRIETEVGITILSSYVITLLISVFSFRSIGALVGITSPENRD